MRIKEVELKTGLTAKAIRLYESKGLLNVARISENDYRDYTEEDVKRLQMISFLREMDISIHGIKDWVDGKLTLQDLMRFAVGESERAQNSQKLRGEMASEILKLLQVDPDTDVLEAMEDVQTLHELKLEMNKLSEQIRGNLIIPVMSTIITLGPVGWTIIHILMNRAEDALISFGLSIIGLIVVFISWTQYFRVESEKRTRSGCLPRMLLAVVAIAIVLGLLCFVTICQEALFVTHNDSLILFRPPWINILILAPIVEIFLGYSLREDKDDSLDGKPHSLKYSVIKWISFALINLVLLYGCITSTSVYDSNGFMRHSFFRPYGQRYSIDQIDHVEVGFYGGSIPIFSSYQTGDFYYKIYFENGHCEDWAGCSPADDSYAWDALVKLDQVLMSSNVPKSVDIKHRDKALVDQETMEIFDVIINNK